MSICGSDFLDLSSEMLQLWVRLGLVFERRQRWDWLADMVPMLHLMALFLNHMV
jgi:hypothetical protein